MDPREILDRTETCQKLGISRQTLLSWIRKGKLKVWKRVGTGSNSALLFDRNDIEALCDKPQLSEAGEEAHDDSAEQQPSAA
jgi:predicted site-specific integrase-resolvase